MVSTPMLYFAVWHLELDGGIQITGSHNPPDFNGFKMMMGKKSFFGADIQINVGGATKLYGAALYRLRPQDFGELNHVDGISPAWPLSYDDFEPWYTKAEWLYQVHGNAGEDPTEGPRSKPYPWPAVSHGPRIQQLFDELAAGGYHPFHAPCGILLDEADPAKSTCIRCTWCDGYPCLVHAKADAETIAVRPMLDRPTSRCSSTPR